MFVAPPTEPPRYRRRFEPTEPRRPARDYWRSLEELADSPVFEEFVQREFPQQAEEWNDPVERRTFLKLMGASLALAGLSGCVIQPPEKVIPYVKQPEEETPGPRSLVRHRVFARRHSDAFAGAQQRRPADASSKAIPIIRTIATVCQNPER